MAKLLWALAGGIALAHAVAAQSPCIGDCNGDGTVRINELISGVAIALGSAPAGDCLAIDADDDGQVRVNELILAVSSALEGCESTSATATPAGSVATEIPDTPTPSPTATGQPETCTCSNAADVCDRDGVCVRADFTCNALNACDESYQCRSGVCQCSDDTVCGVACEQSTDCPGLKVCESGLCRNRLICTSDLSCAGEERCMLNPFGSRGPDRACAIPENRSVGEPCRLSTECASGVCSDLGEGVCLQACTANEECDEGLVCSGGTSSDLGCRIPGDCANCSAPSEHCFRGTCYASHCITGADCPSGRCAQVRGTLLRGARTCTDEGTCTEGEFSFRGDETYCLSHTPCFNDGDCGEPYRCLGADDLNEFAFAQTLGVCGR